MQNPEASVIEGLTAIAAVVGELEKGSEQALARRLKEANRKILHGLIEIASRKETAPEHRSDPTDFLRLIAGQKFPGGSSSTPVPPSITLDPSTERLKVLRGARTPSRKGAKQMKEDR